LVYSPTEFKQVHGQQQCHPQALHQHFDAKSSGQLIGQISNSIHHQQQHNSASISASAAASSSSFSNRCQQQAAAISSVFLTHLGD